MHTNETNASGPTHRRMLFFCEERSVEKILFQKERLKMDLPYTCVRLYSIVTMSMWQITVTSSCIFICLLFFYPFVPVCRLYLRKWEKLQSRHENRNDDEGYLVLVNAEDAAQRRWRIKWNEGARHIYPNLAMTHTHYRIAYSERTW